MMRLPKSKDNKLAGLLELEQRLFRNVTGLIESVLRMGLTAQSPTYNPTLLKERMTTVRELVDLARPYKKS